MLIFDEPTKGLEPAGIREIRNTMRSPGQQGEAVLMSSHLLDKVEQVADMVSITGHGRLLVSGPVAELIGDQTATSIRFGVAYLVTAQCILTESGLLVHQDGCLVVMGASDGAQITGCLAAHDLFGQRAHAGARRPQDGDLRADRRTSPRNRASAAMTRLTKVELRRLVSRRLTVIAPLGAMAATGFALFASYQQASRSAAQS